MEPIALFNQLGAIVVQHPIRNGVFKQGRPDTLSYRTGNGVPNLVGRDMPSYCSLLTAHCSLSFNDSVRSRQYARRNRQAYLLGGF